MTVYGIERAYQDAIENFNFKRAKKVMDFLNWTWRDNKHVPTIDELKKHVEYLYRSALEYCFNNHEEEGGANSGGFKVSIQKIDNVFHVLIEFIVEDFDGEYEENENQNELCE